MTLIQFTNLLLIESMIFRKSNKTTFNSCLEDSFLKTVIWVLVGLSASGKTTLAENINSKLGIPIVSHSAILDELAKQRGLNNKDFVFNTPQDEFKQIFDTFSIEKIDILIKNKNEVLIEALASINVLSHLVNNPSNSIKIIFIDVPKDERTRRMVERCGLIDDNIDRIKIFIGLDKIIEKADFVIDGMELPSVILEKTISIMRSVKQHSEK